MFLVGLTGGIASGKSTVSSQLRELGCPVIDADVVARKGVMDCTFACICNITALYLSVASHCAHAYVTI